MNPFGNTSGPPRENSSAGRQEKLDKGNEKGRKPLENPACDTAGPVASEIHESIYEPLSQGSLASRNAPLQCTLHQETGRLPQPMIDGSSVSLRGDKTSSVHEESHKAKEADTKRLADAKRQNEKSISKLKARIDTRANNRVLGLPSPALLEVHHDKLDGYALNFAHEVGKEKARRFETAGFKLVNQWEKNKPESWRKTAAADPEYQEKRTALIYGLKLDALTGHATRRPHPKDEKYYTEHALVAPGVDPSRAVVAKAAWQYDRTPDKFEVGRLTTLIPSGYSTDEDRAALDKLEKNQQSTKEKKHGPDIE